MATTPSVPVVQPIVVEEPKPLVEVDTPATKRKNRKNNNNIETTAVATPSSSGKKN